MTKDEKDDLAAAQQRVKHGRQQDEGGLVIRTTAMPSDTNPSGDIFGGSIMSQMDRVAGNMAGRLRIWRGAIVAVDAIQFLRPLKVGDEMT